MSRGSPRSRLTGTGPEPISDRTLIKSSVVISLAAFVVALGSLFKR